MPTTPQQTIANAFIAHMELAATERELAFPFTALSLPIVLDAIGKPGSRTRKSFLEFLATIDAAFGEFVMMNLD